MKQKSKLPECKYRCENCDNEWTEPSPRPVSCRRCNHNYVKWVNSREYLLIFEKNRILEEEKSMK